IIFNIESYLQAFPFNLYLFFKQGWFLVCVNIGTRSIEQIFHMIYHDHALPENIKVQMTENNN
ncbi:MAG: hypothetical protein OEV78_10650, partial [Spirochaetia bacterium]|nr:hypothetical protein [Spirochaetia bacterium]